MAPFNKNIKLADLLSINPQLILMLPRFEIALGFGEKRVKDVCEESNVPVNLFLMLCNVYTFDDYLPLPEEIAEIDGSILIRYLKASHDYYLDQRLKHIGCHIERIAEQAGTIQLILMKFFNDYKNEVKKHFATEEKTLFPYIESLIQRTSPSGNAIDNLEKSHGNINNKLSDMTNIIIKYLAPEVLPNERISVWFDIAQLSKDLNKHAIIEEKILIPFVKLLEGGSR